ncbi:hypothetical protein llap_9107 [Limosa lapponica baueri]|uniref:Uncharacterized protein n=1 Tax=Limosa lapponica baueri TaxID=1758121 RepID=A0A2I0U3C8_LIMLA|nr:hypothetical protein llap_9107 [Limosa lapponica baueri]
MISTLTLFITKVTWTVRVHSERELQCTFRQTSNSINIEHRKVEEVKLWRRLLEETEEGKRNNEMMQKGGLVAAELKDIGGTKDRSSDLIKEPLSAGGNVKSVSSA